jgi:murein DD-endopeptidase MepM/ murein hydrolase activator NlpD
MRRKKFTLIFVPNSQGVPRQIRIPVWPAFIGLVVAAITLVGCLFLASQFFNNQVATAELGSLRAENDELSRKFEQVRWNLTEVESRYQTLIDKEVSLRVMFDLPRINPAERQLGIGGPEPAALATMSEAKLTARQTEVQVDRLLKLSEFELAKYQEVEVSLEALQTRLNHTPSIWPTKGWHTSGYGMRDDPFTGMRQMHRGIDVANHVGTPVIATADGKVVRINKNRGLGRIVTIEHGYGFRTRYGHISKATVKVGQRVKRGDVIALMGSTGHSTGPHLHYEVLRNGQGLNPMDYILNKI